MRRSKLDRIDKKILRDLQEDGRITNVDLAKRVIFDAKLNQFLRIRSVQGFTFSGIGVIIHAVEHYSYHTGQIAFWVKQLKNKDLGFYDEMDLNIKGSLAPKRGNINF